MFRNVTLNDLKNAAYAVGALMSPIWVMLLCGWVAEFGDRKHRR